MTAHDGAGVPSMKIADDSAELRVGRHASRWGRAYISVSTSSPWTTGADAVVLPVAPSLSDAGGYWVSSLEHAGARSGIVPRLRETLAGRTEMLAWVDLGEVEVHAAGRRPLKLLVVVVPTAELGDRRSQVERLTKGIIAEAEAAGLRSLAMPLLVAAPDPSANAIARAMFEQLRSMPPPVSLRDVVIVGPSVTALAGIGAPPVRAQAFTNDTDRGEDLLDTETEVSALAEMLLLRELEPPLVLGVLGGWGSGKSFAMRLIAERMHQVRCLPVADEHAWPAPGQPGFAYVGHVYPVHFDAWTYAKADLWSSLMQTIFIELERQLTLEQQLAEVLVPNATDDTTGPEILAEQRRAAVRRAGRMWGVLAELDPQARRRFLESNLGQEALAHFQQKVNEDGSTGRLWEELRRRTEARRKTLEEQTKRLDDARLELQTRRAALQRIVDEEAAWETYSSLLRAQAGVLYDRVRAMIDGKDPKIGPLDRLRAIPQLILARPLEFAIVVGVVVAIFGIAWLMFSAISPAADESWVKVAWGTVTSIVSAIGVYIRSGQALWSELLRHYSQFQALVERVSQTHTEAKQVRVNQLVQADARISELVIEVDRYEAGVSEAKRDLSFGDYRSLHEFVRARVEGDAYDTRLGPLHGIQADLVELSRALVPTNEEDRDRAKSLFPRGPARVALFIDDLDRCPPERVVEVLEATQLLLKTRLFVVVMALDVRFVSRSLEAVYRGVLARHGSPSGLDFIEKIIQVPYRVRPVDRRVFPSYLRAQVVVEDEGVAPELSLEHPDEDAPRWRDDSRGLREGAIRRPTDPVERLMWQQLPSNVLAFTRSEAEHIEECGGRVRLSPRAAKRLINVYKALKILWYRQPNMRPRSDSTQRAVVGLLALSCGYPGVMGDVFTFLETPELHDGAMRLRDLVGFLRTAVQRPAFQDQMWSRAATDAREIIPDDLELGDLDRTALELARAFSFVGDLGWDPADPVDATYFDPDVVAPHPRAAE